MYHRDKRYWNYESEDKTKSFGYTRDSVSHTIVALITQKIVKPEQTHEIEFLQKDEAVYVLKTSAALFSSIFQTCIALNCSLFKGDAENEFDLRFIGKTVREARREYGEVGEVRVAMFEKVMIKLPFEYVKSRMNVSISPSGNIDRILGFY